MIITVKGKDKSLTKEEVRDYKYTAFNYLDQCLGLIGSSDVRDMVSAMWEKAPDYFFVVPASVSGKYHGDWSTDVGGLIRHVIMGTEVVDELADTFGLNDDEKDSAIAALLCHDILKYGIDFDHRYIDMHPFMPRSYFGYKNSEGYIGQDLVSLDAFETVMSAIESHMGNLKEGSWTSVGGIKPETPVQKAVHLADYIASRPKLVSTRFISGFNY
ncbi:HD domain-containing protein [Bacillus pumilus]|uniref:HD domain-containing protein n=1 Tax=Bacillus TaxID=1386 RepID=UPI001C238169|nr:HD domain-containing protein [Bacillus pumilus]MBU8576424.1 HD domain-containing protein [Bacillus pumilus]